MKVICTVTCTQALTDADFSMTQLVDGKRGVHAMIAKSLFAGR